MADGSRLNSHPVVAVAAAIVTVALGASSGMWLTEELRPHKAASVSEPDLWRGALRFSLPSYPAAALREGVQGVVISHVVHAPDGRVRSVRILESPDARLSSEVEKTITQWQFVRTRDSIAGNVTVYFRIEGGRGLVEAPGLNRLQQTTPPKPAQSPNSDSRNVGGWSLPAAAKFISEEEFVRRMGEPHTVALDVRSKANFDADHRPGTINIPLKDLPERSAKELKGTEVILLDCSRNATDACLLCSWTLAKLGVREIAIRRHDTEVK